ncbi:MAG TPA: class I SAM-dependent methyltransferase [Anaeromyxobacter sp.]
MTFAVAAEAYDRFMGRYSRELAPRFLDFAGVEAGPALDVGCGPGDLTSELVARLGGSAVAAVDPSEPFVAACRARVPAADVRLAPAEALPFADATFQVALSQLVLTFVRAPDRAAAELSRVVRRGGTVAACTFETAGLEVVRVFWQAARRLDPAAPDDAGLPFRTVPELVGLWTGAGFREIATGVLDVASRYADFEDCWMPFTYGIGPAGSWLAAQPEQRKARVREAFFELLGRPAGAFVLPARAIAVRGRV